MKRDRDYMALALAEARAAAATGEMPVGAVVVSSAGDVVSSAHNLRERDFDATAHAEILAIREAGAKLGSWRLPGCSLYVTLEPCPMCTGAIIQARLSRLVYGAPDSVMGAVDSLLALPAALGSGIEVRAGVMEDDCRAVLQEFFIAMRLQHARLMV